LKYVAQHPANQGRRMKVVGGSASLNLAQNLARVLGVDYVSVQHEKHPGGFPDGEQYVRLQASVKGEDIVVVQTTHPDSKIIELLLLEDAVREGGAASLTLVIPYFGYGRQDKKFEEGEGVSARVLAKHVQAQADAIYTMGLHNPSVLGYFDVPAKEVDGMPAVARYLKGRGVDLVLSPDKGAVRHAKEVSEAIGASWDWLEKERIDSFTVRMAPKNLDARGKRVAIVDDVISTGRTIVSAANAVKEQGATGVMAACLHGLFTANALEHLKVCDDVVSTDTVPSPMSKISVAEDFAVAIKADR